MIFILLSVTFLALGLFLVLHYNYLSIWNTLGFLSCGLGVILTIVVVMMPIGYHASCARLRQIEEFRETLERGREKGVKLEKASIMRRAAKHNEYIAKVRYWNDTVFDWFFTDEYDDVEMIR